MRFDDAPRIAADVALAVRAALDDSTIEVIVVRGVTGQVSLLVLDHGKQISNRTRTRALDKAQEIGKAGAFAASMPLAWISTFSDPAALLSTEAFTSVPAPDGTEVRLLERVLVGEDWFASPATESLEPVRATLFGIKGGVGRSTAAVALAACAVRANQRVLMIDLDLESPGLGPILLGRDLAPEFGVIDYLVEGVVGQADAELIDQAFASARIGGIESDGEVIVAPAGGTRSLGGNYGAKLARLYLSAGAPPRGLGARIQEAVQALEERIEPDLTIIDSRAGIHDLAAIAITQHGARGFLFGAGTPQTFDGYRLLFDRWRSFGAKAGSFRERLKMVAALLPGPNRVEAREWFLDRSWDLFTTYLYDEVEPGSIEGGFLVRS